MVCLHNQFEGEILNLLDTSEDNLSNTEVLLEGQWGSEKVKPVTTRLFMQVNPVV